MAISLHDVWIVATFAMHAFGRETTATFGKSLQPFLHCCCSQLLFLHLTQVWTTLPMLHSNLWQKSVRQQPSADVA